MSSQSEHHETGSDMQTYEYDTNTTTIFGSPVQDVDFAYRTSPISFPQPAVAGGHFPLPSHLRLQPTAEIRTSRSASPPQTSRGASKAPFDFPPGVLNRTSSVLAKKQSQSDSMFRLKAPQRASSSTIAPPASMHSMDSSQRRHKNSRSSAIAEFFTGSSEVISAFNGPSKRSETSCDSVQTNHNRRPSYTRAAGSSLSSAASSLFTRGRNSQTKITPPGASKRIAEEDADNSGFEHDDEFLNLRVERELFPDARGDFDGVSGTPEEAFDALLANAERLFMRMQIAYQAKHEAMLMLKARKKEEAYELEEAKERNEHLKAQLDTLASEVREKDNELQRTTERLHVERELRQVDAEKRVRSVRIVRANEGTGFRSEPVGSEASSVYSSQVGSSDGGAMWSRPASRSSGSISSMPDDLEMSNFSPGQFGGGLREENLRLKARIAELEDTVEGCLGLVHDL